MSDFKAEWAFIESRLEGLNDLQQSAMTTLINHPERTAVSVGESFIQTAISQVPGVYRGLKLKQQSHIVCAVLFGFFIRAGNSFMIGHETIRMMNIAGFNRPGNPTEDDLKYEVSTANRYFVRQVLKTVFRFRKDIDDLADFIAAQTLAMITE